ncbi:MAG: hypothetical protein JWQ47_392 [Glaciihabitans sp.]|nr:hypothetical protein [Glaciihabitans sp.]
MRNSASAVFAVAAVVALGTGLFFSLGGCVQQPHAILPTSSPSVAPVFRSDADALAAAKKTFDGYLLASDSIGNDGGKNPGRLSAWESGNQYKRDEKVFTDLESRRERIAGATSYSGFRLQSLNQDSKGVVSVITYACLDISKTSLLDPKNQPIKNDGPTVAPLVLTFVNRAPQSESLLVDRSSSWDGNDFC